MNSLVLGFRNVFRNNIRSFSIIVILGLSIGLSLTMLVARQTVEQKIKSVESNVGNTIAVSPAGFRGFSGTGNPLTTAQMATVSKLPNVVSVTSSITDRLDSTKTNLQSSVNLGSLGQRFGGFSGGSGFGGTSQPANFTPPVQVIGTTDLSTLSSAEGGGNVKLTSGQTFNPLVDQPVALVGSSLATKNNLKVGSTFQAYGTSFTVDGIFNAGNTFANDLLIMPLPTVQRLSGQTGDITSAEVQVNSVGNVSSVVSSIQAKLGSSADVVSEQTSAAASIAPLQNIKNISLYSLIGAIIAGSVIILLTMVMIVRERRREIGVLKAIGASNMRVISQFIAEAVTLTLLGAVIGILLGVAGSSPVTNALVSSNTNNSAVTATAGPGGGSRAGGGGFTNRFSVTRGIGNNIHNLHAVVSWSVLAYGLAAAILIAVIGSSVAAWFVVKIRPSEVMRTE